VPARAKPAKRAAVLGPEQVRVDDLYFDPLNSRIGDSERNASQDQLLKVLWRDFAVDEIALSIASNGFFQYEPLFASKEKGRLVVIEGNRRLAAVKLLRSAELRRTVGATDLPQLGRAELATLETLPVIVCTRDKVWQHLGFKHINGPQAWGSEAKAKYIAWVHTSLGVPLPDIARTIGDTHLTVERLYRAHAILEQAEDGGVWDRADRLKSHFSFSHLYTGLTYSGIQKFLGLKSEDKPVPKSRLANLGELLVWLYGSKSGDQPPVVRSQNPDLRLLDEALKQDRGIVALRRGMPLEVSVEISRGDERVFRESVQGAKQSLQKAIGLLLTGFEGESDLVATIDEIVELANKLQQEVTAASPRKSRRTDGVAKKK